MTQLPTAIPAPLNGAVQPLPEAESGGINLQEIWRATLRRRRLVVVVGGLIFGISVASTVVKRITSPVYSGGFQILITDPISSGGSSGAGGGSNADAALSGGGVVETLARNRTSVDVPTLIQTLTSPLVLDPIRKQLGAASAPLYNLQIAQAGDRRQAGQVSGVLQITLQGGKPQEVQRAAQALSEAYIDFALNQKQERLAQGLLFLDQQEPLLTSKVNALESELAAFRRRHNLLEPETEATVLKEQSLDVMQQQREIQADRIRLLKLRQEIAAGRLTAANFSSGNGSSAGAGSGGANNNADGVSVTQARSDLLDQLQSVEQQLAQARSVYRSDVPRVQNLVALRNRLAEQRRSQQLEAVDTALTLNATRGGALNKQTQQLDQQFLKQPNLIKDYNALQKRLDVAQNNLRSFLSTRATFQLEQAQNTDPWKLISPPQVKGYPEEPSLKKGLLQGLLLGAAFGIGAGLLRDRLDHVFRNPTDVKLELGEALLGHIPHVPFFQGVRENKRFLLQELDLSIKDNDPESAPASAEAGGESQRLSGYQRFFYQEAFRNLFTSLRFLNSDKQLRSVALTSSLPAEGKTLVNVLLAKTLSEMGQRVLLVDADLRKPQIHHRLGLNNITGLSNLISTPELAWQQLVSRVEGYPNWSVLTAGTRPPDPARLLSSNRMKELVNELAESGQFDLVLYDTPPVLGLADAALVAQHIDGLILLVSLERVDRGMPKEAAARIRSSGASLLGVVTNAVKQESNRSGGYGYGYGGYGYGYGYGGYGYGYGYGGYGYGYGPGRYATYGSSLDPRAAYTYYGDTTGDAETEPAATTPRQAFLQRVKRQQQRLMRWLDT